MRTPEALNESILFDSYILFYFLKKLSLPFKKWEAYKRGIIDADGNVLRKRSTLKTQEDKNAFGIMDIMILNMKKLLGQTSKGRSHLMSFAAAAYLTKESKQITPDMAANKDILCESFFDFCDLLIDKKHNIKFFNKVVSEDCGSCEQDKQIEEFFLALKEAPKSFYDLQKEEVPANAVGSGGVAGLNDPAVALSRPRKIKRYKEYSVVD